MADSSGSTTSESFPASWTGRSKMDLCRLYEDLIRSIFTFLAETRKRLLLRCRHECYLAPVGFHHYILLVSAGPRIKRRGYDGCSSNSI